MSSKLPSTLSQQLAAVRDARDAAGRASRGAKLANLGAVTQRIAARGQQTDADLSDAQRPAQETPLARLARRLAGATLRDTAVAGQARLSKMMEAGAARDQEEELLLVRLRQIEEFREKMRQVWESRRAGPDKRRSQRFHAEVRRIEQGDSSLTIWQALQRERQFQRNRLYRLDLATKCAQEGRPVP